MAANKVVKTVDFLSRRDGQGTQENPCIRPVVLDICTRYEASRIFCMRCGNGELGCDGQNASCAVGMECGRNGIANSNKRTLTDRFGQEQHGSSALEQSNVSDIVVHTEIDDLHLKASALIESATWRLRQNGIFIIVLPFRGGWETLLIAARTWWNRWNGDRAQFWSRRRLSALLESRGFKILETIKVRAFSRQKQVIILVARKKTDHLGI